MGSPVVYRQIYRPYSNTSAEKNLVNMRRAIRVKAHQRRTERGVVPVRSYWRNLQVTRPYQRGRLYCNVLPRGRPDEIVRAGYRDDNIDLGGSLKPTGPTVYASARVTDKKRVGLEHNLATGLTKPTLEDKGRPVDHRRIIRHLRNDD